MIRKATERLIGNKEREQKMDGNPVGWFEIYVEDMARAKAFYQAVFNTELALLNAPEGGHELEMWAFASEMSRYGAGGALVKMDGCPPGMGGTLVYFACEDCAVEAERATAHGGKLYRSKFAIGEYGFIALIGDSEGNMIGLHSMQ